MSASLEYVSSLKGKQVREINMRQGESKRFIELGDFIVGDNNKSTAST